MYHVVYNLLAFFLVNVCFFSNISGCVADVTVIVTYAKKTCLLHSAGHKEVRAEG